MIELKINEQVVDVMEETVISYNYDLYGEVLSNFTTSYTNSIDLPMTPRNKGVFGYPNVTYGDIGQYTFELYRDGILMDTGSVLVEYVNDDVISINLFSQLITKGEELGNVQSFADCIRKNQHDLPVIVVPSYNSQTEEWESQNLLMSRGDISMNISSLVDVPAGIYYKDSNNATTSRYLYLATANIGKPKALNCDSYYDANASPKIKQWPEGGERTILQTLNMGFAEIAAPAIQTRFYDLQPVMPVDVFFLNLFNGRGITISQGVHRLFNGEENVCPKSYITLPSLREWLEDQTYNAVEKEPSDATVASTIFTEIYPVDGSVKIRGSLISERVYWGSLKEKIRRIAIQLITITARHGSDNPVVKKYMVYTDGAWKYVKGSPSYVVRQWYKNDEVTKLQRKDLVDSAFVIDGLTDGVDYTVTVECTGYYQTNSSFQYGQGQVLVYKGASAWETRWINLWGTCTTSGQRSTFKIWDYFNGIKEPWKLAVDICKQFNLRFVQTSPSTMELCLGCAVDSKFGALGSGLAGEYYDIPDGEYGENIDKYLDWSNFKIVPQVFESKTVTFTPEFNETQWDEYVEKNYVYPYGTRVEVTNYPIKSEEEWFEWNTLKHLSTFYTWNVIIPPIPNHSTTPVNKEVRNFSQAFDKDENQVSIAYSLCTLSNRHYRNVGYICNEMQSSDFCYYGQDYLIDHMVPGNDALNVNYMPHIGTLWGPYEGVIGVPWCFDQYLFGERVMPAGVTVPFAGFGDVLDQMQSSKLVLKVFLDKMLVDINEFVRKVYYIDGSNYIVGAVHNYAIGSGSPCEVEFIKVIDMKNYKVKEGPTVE